MNEWSNDVALNASATIWVMVLRLAQSCWLPATALRRWWMKTEQRMLCLNAGAVCGYWSLPNLKRDNWQTGNRSGISTEEIWWWYVCWRSHIALPYIRRKISILTPNFVGLENEKFSIRRIFSIGRNFLNYHPSHIFQSWIFPLDTTTLDTLLKVEFFPLNARERPIGP